MSADIVVNAIRTTRYENANGKEEDLLLVVNIDNIYHGEAFVVFRYLNMLSGMARRDR